MKSEEIRNARVSNSPMGHRRHDNKQEMLSACQGTSLASQCAGFSVTMDHTGILDNFRLPEGKWVSDINYIALETV